MDSCSSKEAWGKIQRTSGLIIRSVLEKENRLVEKEKMTTAHTITRPQDLRNERIGGLGEPS